MIVGTGWTSPKVFGQIDSSMILNTHRLLLREIQIDDGTALNAIESNEQVTRYQTFDPRTPEDTRAHIQRAIKQQSDSPRLFYDLAIVLLDSKTLIGRCGLGMFRPEHFEAGIWYELGIEHWGKGYASEAVSALLPFVFNELRLHRLVADCDPRNEASCRLVRKLGFKLEGTHRENYWLKGEWCNTEIYAMLRSDWRAD